MLLLEDRWGGREELRRRMRVLFCLKSDSLVPFLGAVLEDDGGGVSRPVLLVSEFMDGGNVEHFIRSRRLDHAHPWVPPPQRIFKWSCSIATALVHLHARGLVHGNLRPSNLLLSGDAERLYVATAPILSPPEHGLAAQPGTSSLDGCVYSAPEVLWRRPYTGKADIYAFAFIVWFFCTGIRPLAHLDNDGEHDPEEHVLEAFREGKVPRPNLAKVKLGRDMKMLIHKAWDKDPHQRPDCKEVLAKLEDAQRGQPQCCALQ